MQPNVTILCFMYVDDGNSQRRNDQQEKPAEEGKEEGRFWC